MVASAVQGQRPRLQVRQLHGPVAAEEQAQQAVPVVLAAAALEAVVLTHQAPTAQTTPVAAEEEAKQTAVQLVAMVVPVSSF
jgi:hypothetical protein